MPAPLLVLASASRRRAQFLAALKVGFCVQASGVDESRRKGESADAAALRLAAAKAAVRRLHPQATVVAADTCMQVDGRIAGKPADRADARRMLKSFAECRAAVFTALCVAGSRGQDSLLRSGRIDFGPCSDDRIDTCLAASPTALQAEGAFAVDEAGSLLCTAISEDEPGTIAGLPMISLCRLLAGQGVELP